VSGWDEALCGPPFESIAWRERAERGSGGLVIAPEGPGAWRLMAWPVADALFDWPPPEPGAGALVTGGSAADRDAVASELRALSPAMVAVDGALRLEALRDAAVVVMLGGVEALPPLAFAPLAARRALVTPRRLRSFGLSYGIELLAGETPQALTQCANVALRHPASLEMMRALGALAAERQRSSTLKARLERDARRVDAPQGSR
jgi:hypothetical protein